MGISSSMYVALSGMNMAQAGMEVASNNIANVNTEGYSRQRLNLETMTSWPSSIGHMGTGVTAQNIDRYHDELLTRNIITQGSEYGYYTAQKTVIDSVEALFNESDGNGINEALSTFWNMWDSIASGAEEAPTREEMVSIFQTLASQVSNRYQDLDAVRQELNSRVLEAVDDINSLIAGIAEVNQQIMVMEDRPRNQQANDLRDTREAMLTQLGQLVDIQYWEDPTNGAVSVSFSSGPSMIKNGEYYAVGTELDEAGNVRLIANYRRSTPPWPEDVTYRVEGGAVGGWLQFRDGAMKDMFLQYESFVDNLMFQVNNQHAQGVGQKLYSSITSSSLISNHPSQTFSFEGNHNDLIISALVPHSVEEEPYYPNQDPDNIAVRFIKAEPASTNEISSSVRWNDESDKWEISITLPTDSNGNITSTARDVIDHINVNKSKTPVSAAPSLPPKASSPYKIGDFITVTSAPDNNWTGTINFNGASYPSGIDQFTSLDRTLANAAGQGHHLSYGAQYASLSTSFKHSSNDVTFTAKNAGADGEHIAVEFVNAGANQNLSVNVFRDVDGTRRISVNLATDANGNITSTALDVKELINSDRTTRDLVKAEVYDDGLGVVKEMDASHLDRSGYFELVTYTPYGDSSEPTIYRVTVDPTDTLQDLASRIGASFGEGIAGLRAEIITDLSGNDVLRIVSDTENGIEYGFREDTSGALAVLGLNNIFTGDAASNIGVNQSLIDNPSLLAAGRIADDGRFTEGDNTNALDMADLKDQRFSFYNLPEATLDTAFNTLYSDIGATNNSITSGYDYALSTLETLNTRLDTLAGVNLDEELADVLSFQYMYQASAKMITTIDEMMETLLAIR